MCLPSALHPCAHPAAILILPETISSGFICVKPGEGSNAHRQTSQSRCCPRFLLWVSGSGIPAPWSCPDGQQCRQVPLALLVQVEPCGKKSSLLQRETSLPQLFAQGCDLKTRSNVTGCAQAASPLSSPADKTLETCKQVPLT